MSSSMNQHQVTVGGGSGRPRLRSAFWYTVALVDLAVIVVFGLLWFWVIKI